MSAEKLTSFTELEQSSKEKILKRIQILLKAEHTAAKNNGSVKFDFENGDFVKGYEKELKQYIGKMNNIELNGNNYRILGWDVFQKNGEKDTDCATIFTVFEGERVGIQELPNQHDVYLPSSDPSVNKGIYLSSRERFELSSSGLPTLIVTPLYDQESDSGELIFSTYYPLVIDGQFPEMLDQVRRMNTREIMPLSEDIEIPF